MMPAVPPPAKQPTPAPSTPPGVPAAARAAVPVRPKPATPDAAEQAARLDRLLELITLLQARRDWTPAALAKHFKVSAKTIYRDLDTLARTGLNVTFDRKAKGYVMPRSTFLAPLQLTPEEALALIVLCEDVAGRGQVAHLSAAMKAKWKIESQLPPELRSRLEPVMDSIRLQPARGAEQTTHGEEQVYRLIQGAIERRRALRLTYASPARPAPSEPFLFEPYTLWFSVRAWYAVGLHRGHGQVRSLKLRRIRAAALTQTPYTIPDDFSIDDHIGNAWQMIRGHPDHPVALRVAPPIADTVADTRWHHTQEAEHHPDGSITLRFTVAGLDEIVWWVLSLGPACTVLQPPELARRVADLAVQIAANYARPTATDHP